MNLVVRAEQQPLWLCFEPWANQYTLLPGTSIVVRFPDDVLVEVVHHRDGMTFFNVGAHPDLYGEDGTAVEIYSEYMPVFPADMPLEAVRYVMEVIPPIRTEPDRLN